MREISSVYLKGKRGHWKTRKLTKRQMLLLFIARFLIAYTDAVKAARDIIIIMS